jgi:hypothetical protein
MVSLRSRTAPANSSSEGSGGYRARAPWRLAVRVLSSVRGHWSCTYVRLTRRTSRIELRRETRGSQRQRRTMLQRAPRPAVLNVIHPAYLRPVSGPGGRAFPNWRPLVSSVRGTRRGDERFSWRAVRRGCRRPFLRSRSKAAEYVRSPPAPGRQEHGTAASELHAPSPPRLANAVPLQPLHP